MGIVIKQGFYNSLISYIGIVLGYINVVLLFPNIFEIQQFGLTRLLVAIATLYGQIASLGTYRIIIRFFPFFRTEDNKNNGFFVITLLLPLIGFLLMTIFYFIFKVPIINQYKEESSLFTENYYYVIPLALLILYCSVYDGYLQTLYKTVITSFLSTVLIRIVWFIAIILFYFKYLNFDQFLFVFVYAYAINLMICIAYLFYLKQISFKINRKYFRPKMLKLVLNYGIFSIASDMAVLVVNKIDIIMIGSILNLANTAVYSVAYYISGLVLIPFQAILKIVFPILSSAWKNKKFEKVEDLYKKTSISLFVFGGLIFTYLWVNIDSIFIILPPEYANGKYVFLFIALSQLVNLVTSINGHIIVLTKFYKFDTLASILLAVITVFTNLIFIPLMGIKGAALATAISILLYNISRTIFVYVKFKMQPFSIKTYATTLLFLITIAIATLIPKMDNYILDIIMRSIVITIFFFPCLFYFRISEDINKTAKKILKRYHLPTFPKLIRD